MLFHQTVVWEEGKGQYTGAQRPPLVPKLSREGGREGWLPPGGQLPLALGILSLTQTGDPISIIMGSLPEREDRSAGVDEG